MHQSTKLHISIFILLACLWSGSFIAIKAVVDVWPSLFGAAMRVTIAFLCISLFMLMTRKKMSVSYGLALKIMLTGLFTQGLPFAFLFWGERFISPGLAGILNATVSIWTYILALIFMPEKTAFSLLKSLGLLVGIFGVVCIFSPLISYNHQVTFLFGTAAVVMMAICYAIGALLSQYFLQAEKGIEFFTNLFYQHLGSVIFLAVLVIITLSVPSVPHLIASSKPLLASLYLGIFSTALAYSLYYYLIREWDATHASSVVYLVPALTLLWDYLFYGNIPRASEIIGVVAILIGVGMIQFENFKSKRT